MRGRELSCKYNQVNSGIRGSVIQTVSYWPLIVGARGYVRFVVDKVTLRHISFQVFPCQYYSTNSQYSSSPAYCCHQKDKRAKPGNLPKSSVLSEIGGTLDRKLLPLFQVFATL